MSENKTSCAFKSWFVRATKRPEIKQFLIISTWKNFKDQFQVIFDSIGMSFFHFIEGVSYIPLGPWPPRLQVQYGTWLVLELLADAHNQLTELSQVHRFVPVDIWRLPFSAASNSLKCWASPVEVESTDSRLYRNGGRNLGRNFECSGTSTIRIIAGIIDHLTWEHDLSW